MKIIESLGNTFDIYEILCIIKNCRINLGLSTENSDWDQRGNEFLATDIIICPFKRTTTAQRVLYFATRHCIRTLLESYNGYMLLTKYNKVHTLVTVSLIILVLVMKVSHLLQFSFIIFSIIIHKKYTRDTFRSNVMLNASNCNIFSKSTISHLIPMHTLYGFYNRQHQKSFKCNLMVIVWNII